MSINILRHCIEAVRSAEARVNECDACHDAECVKVNTLCEQYAVMLRRREALRKQFYELLHGDGDIDACERAGISYRDIDVKLTKLNVVVEAASDRANRFLTSLEKAQEEVAIANRELAKALNAKEC